MMWSWPSLGRTLSSRLRRTVFREVPAGRRLTVLAVVASLPWLAMAGRVQGADGAVIPEVAPEVLGMDAERLQAIDAVVQEGLDQGKMPGCVVMVGRRGGVVYHKAFGFRQTEPEQQPMLRDTVFDLASLTKPIATATSILSLIERGQISLDATVASYIPEFAANGKESITVRQLLTHQSGLIADNALADYEHGVAEAFSRINNLKPTADPGTRFIYSDVGFIVLGRLVQTVSGLTVHEYSQEHLFRPLQMLETGYLPAAELRARAVVTERREDRWMQGEVHDPRAWLLEGVAGHAGLFSTAADLARYAVMLLNGGRLGDAQVLKPETVRLMTTAQPVSSGWRGLGWDMRTGYSSNRGDLMTPSAFGHGGFTGTAIWMDPQLDLFVVFLSNRVHPDGKGLVNPLAGRIGTIAAAAIDVPAAPGVPGPPPTTAVLNGIDVLQRDQFAALAGRRVGLITNHTGVNRDGVSTVTLLHQADNVSLLALFSPEHGLQGQLDVSRIADGVDAATGLPIYSLYGESRRPSAKSLEGLDTLVFDIQDIGCRFYTYPSTMGNAMRAAADAGLRFVVLDRVNPIGGLRVEGPVLDAGSESFVGYHTLPVRHGMTIGELAQLFRQELQLNLDLQIIRVEGWQRSRLFDETGLTWVNPSPNMRSLTQAQLYPGVGLLEMTNVSVGRGTDTPFEVLGAPWIRERELAEHLNEAGLPGVRFVPIRFTPTASKFKGETCGGVNIIVMDRRRLDAVHTGIQLMCSLRALFAEQWDTKHLNRLLSSQRVAEGVLAGTPASALVAGWQDQLYQFHSRRRAVLLYE